MLEQTAAPAWIALGLTRSLGAHMAQSPSAPPRTLQDFREPWWKEDVVLGNLAPLISIQLIKTKLLTSFGRAQKNRHLNAQKTGVLTQSIN